MNDLRDEIRNEILDDLKQEIQKEIQDGTITIPPGILDPDFNNISLNRKINFNNFRIP